MIWPLIDGDFDGKFWIEDLDDEFQRGLIYENGAIKAHLSNKELSDKSGRTTCITASYPVTTVTDWISRACVAGGNCYTQPMYSEVKTTRISYLTCNKPYVNRVTTSATKFTDDGQTLGFNKITRLKLQLSR